MRAAILVLSFLVALAAGEATVASSVRSLLRVEFTRVCIPPRPARPSRLAPPHAAHMLLLTPARANSNALAVPLLRSRTARWGRYRLRLSPRNIDICPLPARRRTHPLFPLRVYMTLYAYPTFALTTQFHVLT